MMGNSTRLNELMRINRRMFLRAAGAAGASAWLAGCKRTPSTSAKTTASGANAATSPEPAIQMAEFPEKTSLILRTDRPIQLETPIKYFFEDYTPNDAFFVRWHLSQIPTSVDPATFRLNITGHVQEELNLSLDDLRQMEQFSIVAVNQCSGNSRSYFQPRVFGGQWGNGAMGNAKWTGVRVRDLLDKAKVKNGAADVSFAGMDHGAMPTIPDFVKALAYDHCMDGEVMIAYEMNGASLPMINGYPLRLIVPGWFGTYWVKSLKTIEVLPQKFQGFWMDKAYRIPNVPGINESPLALAPTTVPITQMLVRSLFLRPDPSEKVTFGSQVQVEGLALDSGKGIRLVEISSDGGNTWYPADLGPDLGKYSWRRWTYRWTPTNHGKHELRARASNVAGETQPAEQWNRGGYARNVIEKLEVNVA